MGPEQDGKEPQLVDGQVQEQEGKALDLHKGERGGSVANFYSRRTTG